MPGGRYGGTSCFQGESWGPLGYSCGSYHYTTIYPTVQIYDNILYAFARACDASAAELYFMEMKSKGIKNRINSYNILFTAYSREQSVDVEPYGTMGRFVSKDNKIKKESSESCTRQVRSRGAYLDYIASMPDKEFLLSEISINDLIGGVDCSEVLVSKIFRAGIYNNRIRGKNYVLFDEIFFEKTISGSELSSFSMYDTVESDNFSYRFDLLHVDALSNSLLLQNCVDTFNGAINHAFFNLSTPVESH